jgi:hypothetical protein
VIAAWAGLAAGAAAASYPAALDRATLSAWLSQSTSLAPGQVIAVSPSAATAIVSRVQTSSGRYELLLRAVALTPEAAQRGGMLSWEMRLSVDCVGGRVRSGETTGYAARVPDGDAVAVAPAQPDWRIPRPGTALESAFRAVCDTKFRLPLAERLQAAAIAPPAAPEQPKLAQALHVAETPGPAPASQSPPPPAPPKAGAQAATAAARDASTAAPGTLAPPRRGDRAVQVVSSPVEADARRSLAGLRSRFGDKLAGLETRVAPAQVRGRTVYRGFVAGFATHDEAKAFCQALKPEGQACLAR